MKFLSLRRLGWLISLLLVCAVASAAQVVDSVNVHYRNPDNFTEMKRSFGMNRVDTNAYLVPLKRHIEQRAARILTPGERLDIEVTDVDRAGEYEPWRGPDFNRVRIIKDVYPPRIDLNFTLYGADGKVLRQGSRSLRDLSFLDRMGASAQDPLRYEKSLIDRWLRNGPDQL
ncbi:DUF3016 domain-containing protein [Rhodanobacter sp. AS-Z3]|uniref:DUF3016 domain-containing protein n=1 Tax=Rhodanobacter sp. AS-Z3 TaxID=3031330 RepID=UPI002479B757|nr:DUF3016 domain-containing protein [Rhodanobacter sp. AS-Z3]WEN15054.1 DUF3016 domain-containing protein [Rhodanobacter sp. AS-Z3]